MTCSLPLRGILLASRALLLMSVLVFIALVAEPGAAVAADAVALPAVTPFELRTDLRSLPLVLAPPRAYRPLLPLPAKGRSVKDGASGAAAEPAAALDPMPAPVFNFAGMSFSDDCGSGVPCG